MHIVSVLHGSYQPFTWPLNLTCHRFVPVRRILGLSPELHAAEPNDVVLGAQALAGRLPLAACPSEPESWEWRAYAEGQNPWGERGFII